jgi:hypothetical protein
MTLKLNSMQKGGWRSLNKLLRENRVVESFLTMERKFRAERRKLKGRQVLLEEPKVMNLKATSHISDARLERLRKYLEKEVKQQIKLPHEYKS